MIPTYSSEKTHKMGIVMHHLGQLNDYDFTKPHRHDYFEFFYFKKGGGNHIIDFKTFPITDNSVHIVAPGQIHQVNRELNSEGYVILFELEMIEAPKAIEDFLFEHICLDAEELKPTFKLKQLDAENNERKLHEVHSALQIKSDLGKLKIINALHGFCIDCMELDTTSKVRLNNDYLLFRKYLKEHFSTVKKVKEFAEMMHISERNLNDLVKKYSGKSASEVISECVIMEGKRLLRTGISVKETAYTLNYDDPAHFSKYFKIKTGQSPSDFQNCT
jgi:AraC family transcriptional activator of pobA